MTHTDLVRTRPAAGRASGRIGGVLLVVEHHWTWYRRNWRATAVSSILQPLLFLLAFGVGFGTLIDGTGRAAQATGGLDYLVWLAPALLCVSAVQTAVFDSTYPVLSGLKWQRHYLAMTATPALTRLTRSGMIQAISSDYIRTARAKGLSRSSIVFKHALRNAAIPVVSIAAVQLGFMLGGSIVIEQVFALHGVGFLAWESIQKNDFPVVQSVVLVLAVIYVVLTMLADLMNAVLDPRLRNS